jgi:hypothetical protein
MSSRVIQFAVFLLTLTSSAGAREWVVSPTGNDDNPGTMEKPLATIDQASSHAASGDVISLRGGEYQLHNFLFFNKPGITLRSAPNEKAVLSTGTNEHDPVAVVIVTADHVSLIDLEIRGGAYYGIKVDVEDNRPPSKGVIIRGCRVLGSGRDCVKTINSDELLIEDCEIGPSGARDSSNAEGIDSMGSKGVTIRRCYVHDTATNGIYLKAGTTNGIVEGCHVENTGEHGGILLGQDSDEGSMRDGVKYEAIDCIARNNIIVNTGAAGIGTYSGYNVRFENNTLVDVAKKSQAAVWIVTNSRSVQSREVLLMNNIICTSGSRPMVMALDLDGPLMSNSNLYYSSAGKYEFCREQRTGGDRYDQWNLDRWRKEMNADQNSMIADPLLIKEKLYRCHESSPAIDHGSMLEDVKTDYAGSPRPQGRGVDMGAFEYATEQAKR